MMCLSPFLLHAVDPIYESVFQTAETLTQSIFPIKLTQKGGMGYVN